MGKVYTVSGLASYMIHSDTCRIFQISISENGSAGLLLVDKTSAAWVGILQGSPRAGNYRMSEFRRIQIMVVSLLKPLEIMRLVLLLGSA